MSKTDKTAFFIENVNVSYDTTPILKDISFSINVGETFGLIGLNGTGKTTLLKTLLGLKFEDSGTIMIEGQDNKNPEKKKNLAYLPERFEPPYFLKGHEFLKFSMNFYGQGYERQSGIEEAEHLALDPSALDRSIHTYSKGMRQKLGLLATILTPCHNIILDEPMSGLDPKARLRVKDAIAKAKEKDRTIFLSSHILADMQEICDRVGVLHDKTMLFLGTPEELIKKTKAETLEKAFLGVIEGEKNVQKAA